MPAPDKVKQSVAAAEKLHAEVYGKDGEKPTAPPPPEAPKPPPTPIKPNIAPDGTIVDTGDVEPPATPPPEEDLQGKLQAAEQRYRTLQGKFDAEVPRMAAQIRGLQEQLEQEQAAPPPPQEQAPSTGGLSDDEVEEYGEDFIDMVRRAAGGPASSEVQEIKDKITQLEAGVGNVSQTLHQTAREKTVAALDNAIPGWRTTNDDPRFIAWLQEVDLYSGAQRLQLLRTAFERNDAARVAAFFKGYAQQTGASTGQATTGEQFGQPPQKAQLDAFVAPNVASNVPPSASEQTGRIWTDSEVKRILDSKARGKLKGTPQEIANLEIEIHNAGVQGRIVPG